MSELSKAVAACTTIRESAATLIEGIAKQADEKLAAELRRESAALCAALTINTSHIAIRPEDAPAAVAAVEQQHLDRIARIAELEEQCRGYEARLADRLRDIADRDVKLDQLQARLVAQAASHAARVESDNAVHTKALADLQAAHAAAVRELEKQLPKPKRSKA